MENFDKSNTDIILCSRTVSHEKKAFVWGGEDYSYRVVHDRFYQFFKRNGFKVKSIDDSRMYHHKISLSGFTKKKLIHIAIQSPNKAKVMPNAYNICSFAWEFDTMPNKDFLANLEHFDELWPTSNQAFSFLKKFIKNKSIVIKRVQIPMSDFYLKNKTAYSLTKALKDVNIHNLNPDEEKVATSADLKEAGYIFSMFNPWDGRKDFKKLIEVFLDKKNKCTEILLLKMSIDGKGTKWNNILGILRDDYKAKNLKYITNNKKNKKAYEPIFKTNNSKKAKRVNSKKRIFIISEKLSDKELYSLYKHSKFTWYTSKCEGTNLPVVESILSEGKAVTPVHTGLTDYLTSSYPLKIDANLKFMDGYWLQKYGFEVPDGAIKPAWYQVDKESNIDILNNFELYSKEFNQNKVTEMVKNYFSDEEILKAINK